MPRVHPTTRVAGLGVATWLAACGAGDGVDRAGSSWQAVTDTIGDTVVVRTVAGSVWGAPADLVPEVRIGVFEGEDVYILGDVRGFAVAPDGSVYIYDRQGPVLRKYAPDGTYLATIGREGGGPGEYRNSDGGVAVLADGSVALRDPGNARMQWYSSSGEPLRSWPIFGVLFSSQPLFSDTAGRILGFLPREASTWPPRGEGPTRLARYTADGTVLDTVVAPDYPYERPFMQAASGRGMTISSAPFTATEPWTYSPLGYMVGAVTTDYAIDLFRPEGVLRIEKEYEPVPVRSDEEASERERLVARMRLLDPDWTWNGPSIPDHKPPFHELFVGADGRLWVALHQEAVPIALEAEAADADADRPPPIPPARWREPVVFDVFEPDGRYLGQVRAPDGFSLRPAPYFRGDSVWAIVRGELNVQRLTRFRIVR